MTTNHDQNFRAASMDQTLLVPGNSTRRSISSLPHSDHSEKTTDDRASISKMSEYNENSVLKNPFYPTDVKPAPETSYNSIELATRLPLPPSTSTVFTRDNNASIEITSQTGDSAADIHRHESALAPVDGGFGAWSFVSIT
jgi:hypothetical protein